MDAGCCDAYCQSPVLIEGAACSPSQAASAAGCLHALLAQPMQDGMQVAKLSCVQATHHAVGLSQLSGALVTTAPAGQGRLYALPHYKPVTLPVSRWPSYLWHLPTYLAYVLPLGQTSFACTIALYSGVTTAGACQASYSECLSKGAIIST